METGIFIRLYVNDKWDAYDIGNPQVTDEQILEWLRSRGGKNTFAENCVLLLLGRKQIAKD
jgi:hypothetical protein